MNKTIKYTCLCGKELEILVKYAKYFLEFKEIKGGKPELVCDECGWNIPLEKLLEEHEKTQAN